MPPIFARRTLRLAVFCRWLAVVLALGVHVGAGARAEPGSAVQAPGAQLAAAMVLCVGANHASGGGQKPIHHHLPSPALAAAGHHLAQTAALLNGAQCFQAPAGHLAAWAVLPEARGPPARYAVGFYPTGPPHLI
jgi:hypothetical protein